MNGCNQCEMIYKYMLKWGSITPAEAYDNLGIMRLPARIHDMREMGFNIKTERVRRKNRFGKPISFARYRLVENGGN